jgi:hypothetical protein
MLPCCRASMLDTNTVNKRKSLPRTSKHCIRRCPCEYYMASNGDVLYEWWILKNMEVNGRHVIEVLSGYFTGGTDQRESEC